MTLRSFTMPREGDSLAPTTKSSLVTIGWRGGPDNKPWIAIVAHYDKTRSIDIAQKAFNRWIIECFSIQLTHMMDRGDTPSIQGGFEDVYEIGYGTERPAKVKVIPWLE